jgi:tetratricopeptide (TPR) repeat protein
MTNPSPSRRGPGTKRWILAGFTTAILLHAAAGVGPLQAQSTDGAEITLGPSSGPPENRFDLGAWMAYQQQVGAPSLPAVAQLYHRRGVETLESGAHEDGVRMLRGAVQLDPTFLAPRLALVSHFAWTDPSQALIELARIIDLARTHYPLQHHLITVLMFQIALALLLATTLVGLYIVWRRREPLRHSYEEFLGRRVPTRAARTGSWVLLAVPYLIGLGLAIPTVFSLGAMWPGLRKSERFVFVMLLALVVALPIGASMYAALSVPDHRSETPFFGTVSLAHSPPSEARLSELILLTDEHPDNPMLRFATGWMAQRGGNLRLARSEFEVAGNLWPKEPRIPNNLGNLAVLSEDYEGAETLYRQASDLDPKWAMPHYNLGQLYTRQFRYAEASEELARATSYDFELVRSLQAEAQSKTGDPVPLAWGWLDPQTYWDELFRDSRMKSGLEPPASWRSWFELRGPESNLLAMLLAAMGLALGFLTRKWLPVRSCSNCGNAVCRRCGKAARDKVYCNACSEAQSEATAPEFSKLLMLRRRRTVRRNRSRWETVLALLLPGFGPVAMNRVWVGWLLLAFAGPALAAFLGAQPSFWYDPRIGPLAPKAFHAGAFILMLVVYVLSVTSYFGLRAASRERESEPARSKKSFNRLPRAA